MMDWNQIRQQWQDGEACSPTPVSVASVQRRDKELRTQVRHRDWLESAVGLLIAPFFAVAAGIAVAHDAWLPALFAAFLAAWALYVPWHLWRNRRLLPQAEPGRPLLDYLRASHTAMLLQARQLEQIWRWYLAPCAIGVIGLTFSVRGPVTGAFFYAAAMLGFCVLVALLNKHVAQTQFRVHAQQIEQQIFELTKEPSA